MDDQVPPLLPEIHAWAIVAADSVGEARDCGKAGMSFRRVDRADGSPLDVIYDSKVDDLECPECEIAKRLNVLVMKGDLRVLDPRDVGPVELR